MTKIQNKHIYEGLFDALNDCKNQFTKLSKECKQSKYNDEDKINKCVELQKEWMRIRKALIYILNDIDGFTYVNLKIYNNDPINFYIRVYGDGGDEQFDKYYVDRLINERLLKFEDEVGFDYSYEECENEECENEDSDDGFPYR